MHHSSMQTSIDRIAKEGLAPVHVQQIVFADGDVHGVEVLLRVPGYSPIQALSFAETQGMLSEVELAVIASSARIASLRPDMGIIHMNVTWKTLVQPGITDRISKTLDAYGVNPEHLSIELSEREMIDDHDMAKKALRSLKNRGFRFAIDDFGVGYNHLSIVSSIPIHCLKIDQSIVNSATSQGEEEDRRRSMDIIQGTKLLADSLAATFVIEGIENPEGCAVMTGLDCAGQGYFFGRPMHVDDLNLRGRPRRAA